MKKLLGRLSKMEYTIEQVKSERDSLIKDIANLRMQRDDLRKECDELIVSNHKIIQDNAKLQQQKEHYKEIWGSLRKEYFESYKRDISLPTHERNVVKEQQKLSFLYMMDILEDTTHLQEFLDEMEDE
ncbi:hypothetical protein GZH82_05565 [Staphylococcus ursi]|uniref:hypothetical protein n=1 Tax=Staphylococcus sp. MI 10-1553 TaxID=1912064 RepID=UPI001397EECE|nr:hypothetical protein [Staphylococcus sp. MI 10-1553]QHW36833.1 hypothetical protein GZH82_05565 [Staphylococcus sp. MI 10-1553]